MSFRNCSRSSQRIVIRTWLIAVAMLYAAACFTPAFSSPDWGVTYGYQCLSVWLHPAWCANLFFLIGFGIATYGLHKDSIPFSLIAIGLVVSQF
jgi:hypothetical protein